MLSTEDWIIVTLAFGLAIALYFATNSNGSGNTITNNCNSTSIWPVLPAAFGAWWLFFA